MSEAKLDSILEAVQSNDEASVLRHKALKAEVMKAIPDNHIKSHETIAKFMGRLEADDHLDDHEYIAPRRNFWATIRAQLACNAGNAGNTIYLIILMGVIALLAQSLGVIPHVN